MKKADFWSILAVFVWPSTANLMSDGKKKRFKFLFTTPLMLLINMSISLFP